MLIPLNQQSGPFVKYPPYSVVNDKKNTANKITPSSVAFEIGCELVSHIFMEIQLRGQLVRIVGSGWAAKPTYK